MTSAPRILHKTHLIVPCEVTVLQSLMVLDQPLDDEVKDDDEQNGELLIAEYIFVNCCKWYYTMCGRDYFSEHKWLFSPRHDTKCR